MGLFFDNIHIHKNEKYDIDVLKKDIIEQFEKKGFTFTEDVEKTNASVVIYTPEHSQWVSVASDLFQFDTEERITEVVEPLSQCFETEIISATCYDSDYLRLSIFSGKDGTDGWLNVGRAEGMKNIRRTSLSPWKIIVEDINALKSIVKEEYIFAEEAFEKIADLIDMSKDQTRLETGCTDLVHPEKTMKLNFLAPEGTIKLPQFVIPRYNLSPCKIGESNVISVYNKGGKARGLGVMFIGDYVDNDEIVFEDVQLQLRNKKEWKMIPIELEKVDWIQGKKCYCWSDPDFSIPPAVNENIPIGKRMDLEFEREIGISFIPVGNSRKVLDIKMVVYPLENSMNGQVSWCVYQYSGSKREYIEEYNERWEGIPIELAKNNILKTEDYDLE